MRRVALCRVGLHQMEPSKERENGILANFQFTKFYTDDWRFSMAFPATVIQFCVRRKRSYTAAETEILNGRNYEEIRSPRLNPV